jgi:DNA-binding NarL/FixJ family response regulator
MRIFVISAYPTVRAGLRALVQAQPGWSVVGEAVPDALAGNAERPAAPDPATTAADVVLAELDGPLSADTLRALVTATQPRAGLVAVGAVADVAAREALRASATADWLGGLGIGMLPRDATGEEIVAAVDAAAGGLVVLDRRLARNLATSAAAQPAPSEGPRPAPPGAPDAEGLPGEPLTPRELEVLQLLAEGLPNKIIANRLRVSEHTAKFHVASIMTKLGAASRTEAVTLAARRGLLIL